MKIEQLQMPMTELSWEEGIKASEFTTRYGAKCCCDEYFIFIDNEPNVES